MSFFGGRPSPASPSGGSGQSEHLQAAQVEVEMVSDLFNRLVGSCFNKCVGQKFYSAGELEKGEGVCVDRCVAKYFAANELVGKKMQQAGEASGGGGAAPSGGLF